jgi:hypothetical protein
VSTSAITGRLNRPGQLHQTHGLAIAFRLAHAEIVLQARLRIATFLVADHHNRLAAEARETAKDRVIVHELAIARELDEFLEQAAHIIHEVRPLRVARDLCFLPGIEMRVDVLELLLGLLAQLADLVLDGRAAGRFKLAIRFSRSATGFSKSR